ncbi:MAG: SIMPL domain-containing protein [Longimicrobiales bacterium]
MIHRVRPRWWLSHGSVILIAPVLLAACAPATAQPLPSPLPSQDGEQGTIEVTGQAQVQVPADRVRISFGVETEAQSASEASAQNAREMEAVVASLRASGVPGLEIETYGYSLTPEYRIQAREDPSRRSISGYRAMNNIRVTVPGVDRAGEVLDAGVAAGANRVVNLQFEASDTREARLEALRSAVRVAREEAQTIAEAMGVTLGPPVEVRGGASPGEPRMFARAAVFDEAAGARTPIEAGAQTVSASVTILFRILEGAR